MEIKDLLSSKKTELKDTIYQWLSKSANNIQIKDGVILVNNQDDYAQNFGLQWNEFQLTQFDSDSGLPLTENRLKECS